MPELIEQTVEIGRDAYGRRVTMKRRRNYDGKTLWSIRSESVSQRDDGEAMDGLTDENVRAMIAALEVIKR
jgi:hypothetical protein